MNADNYFQSDEILNIINKNYNEKITNLRVLNSFKTLYDITGKYEKNDKSYEEVISDSDSRIEFLINSVTIALTNKKIDNKTGYIIDENGNLYFLRVSDILDDTKIIEGNSVEFKVKKDIVLRANYISKI